MKNILLITPFFAPYSHAAVYRAHRFAKYLPRFGWKPYVLTVDKSFLYFVDNALLGDLPLEVEIIRARHLDLSWSGIRSLFEKSDTGITPIHSPTAADLAVQPEQDSKNFLKEAFDKFRHEFIFIPDRYITWYPFALNKAKHLIASKHIDVIYSTALPFTSHLIAMKLKRQFKIPWVADFRDPGVSEEREQNRFGLINYKINCLIEKKVMEEASLVLTFCEGAKNLFSSRYKSIVNDKITSIRTGTDLEILEKAKPKEKSKKFTIIFTGEFHYRYSRFFLSILKAIFERNLFSRQDIEVLIVGSVKRNIFLKKEIELSGLLDVVKLIDYLSLKDYFNVLLSADATLLPAVFNYAFPIKLTDYLFTNKPIIAFNTNYEVRDMLEKSGLGIFVPSETERGVEVLLNLFRGNYKLNINKDYINQFTAFNQTKELCEILNGLTQKVN